MNVSTIRKELLNELSRQIIGVTLETGIEQVIDVFDGKIVVRKPSFASLGVTRSSSVAPLAVTGTGIPGSKAGVTGRRRTPNFVFTSRTMQSFEHNLPVTIAQVLAWVRECSTQEKRILLRTLMDDTASVTMASEPSLAKDWSGADEDEAWKDL